MEYKRTFTHIVVVPCYIDPIDVLFDCLGSLLLQDDISSLLVVVAFEKRTPDLENKIFTVKTAFQDKFGHLLISVHTLDPVREIAGGCSNKNYALREAYKYLCNNSSKYPINDRYHAVTVTTCDTDSLFNPKYFQVLENCYNCKNTAFNEEPKMCVWQSPLFYNWNLDERPFFNRTTGIMRSLMMLGGLISFNLNPMSIFSYPLELGLKVGFINPRYGVDDIIAKVRWMCETNETVPILLLPIASISGPTIGTSFMNEVDEWARQIRRWIVGSSESFHYFVIHFKGYPLFSGLFWFFMFFMYYAVLLCSAGIFTMLAGIPIPGTYYPTVAIGQLSIPLSQISLISLIIQYLVFGVAFIIDRRAIRLMTVTENISIPRNIIHWLLSPITLLVYSMIAFYAIIVFIWNGKKFARHDMAAKDGLLAKTNANMVGTAAPASEISIHEIQSAHEAVNPVHKHTQDIPTEEDRTSLAEYEWGTRGNSRSSSITAPPPIPLKDGPVLLCKLPEQFYFGAYVGRVSEIMDRRNRYLANKVA